MTVVTISSKFRIVIPRDVRRSLGLVPGRKVHVMAVGERVALIPWRSARKMRGFLTDSVKPFERENDRL